LGTFVLFYFSGLNFGLKFDTEEEFEHFLFTLLLFYFLWSSGLFDSFVQLAFFCWMNESLSSFYYQDYLISDYELAYNWYGLVAGIPLISIFVYVSLLKETSEEYVIFLSYLLQSKLGRFKLFIDVFLNFTPWFSI